MSAEKVTYSMPLMEDHAMVSKSEIETCHEIPQVHILFFFLIPQISTSVLILMGAVITCAATSKVPTSAPVGVVSYCKPTISAALVRMLSSKTLQYSLTVSTIFTYTHHPLLLQDVDECLLSNGECDQVCSNIPGGRKCSCRPGFTLDSDGTMCSDVDECIALLCEHECTNTFGGFRCECLNGHTLDSDGTSCTGNNSSNTV